MNARFRDALPAIRGTFVENAALKDIVWFRAGGPAEILFRPADVDDLRTFLAQKPPKMPVSVIGVGSNLLVRDGGIKGVVIRLPASFGKIAVEENRVRAGAAALDAAVARAAADAGLGGLEFLREGIGRAERRDFVVGYRHALDVTALDDRPAGVAPAAQTLKLVRRHDMFVGDDALIRLTVTSALLLRIADAFMAGLLPLFQAPASIAMGLN